MSKHGPADSGLHLAMRSLLGIIAGLLIADALKLVITAVTDEYLTTLVWFVSFATSTAALAFVTRVVADNIVYYTAPDARTRAESFSARTILIVTDLLSYALCYHIVSLLNSAISNHAAISPTMVLRIFADMAAIELFHFFWCKLALDRLDIPLTSTDRSYRRAWLGRWRNASGWAFILAFLYVVIALVLIAARFEVWTVIHTASLVTFVIADIALYMSRMKSQYLGDWEAKIPIARSLGPTGRVAFDLESRRPH